MNGDRDWPMQRHGAVVRAAAAGAAGGPTAAVAVALATFGKPGLAVTIGLLSMAAASIGAVVTGPVGATLARGYVERRLLKAAAAEARRTDEGCAAVAVALIAAVDGRRDQMPRRRVRPEGGSAVHRQDRATQRGHNLN